MMSLGITPDDPVWWEKDDSPPPGMRRLRLLSRREGTTFDIWAELLDSTITAADLEARFGPGERGPASSHGYAISLLGFQVSRSRPAGGRARPAGDRGLRQKRWP